MNRYERSNSALLTALRTEKSEPKGKPFSVRFSETTSREIEAEARLTRRTASDVIKDRMIFGFTPAEERDPHLSYRRRCLMPAIVEKTDDDLLARVKFLRELIEKAQSPQQFFKEELRLLLTELELREKEQKIALARQLGLSDLLKPSPRLRAKRKRKD